MINAIGFTFEGRVQGDFSPGSVAELNQKAEDIAADIEQDIRLTLGRHGESSEPVRVEIGFAQGSLIVTGMALVMFFAGDVLREGLQQELAAIVRMSIRRVLARALATYGTTGPNVTLTVTPQPTRAGTAGLPPAVGRTSVGMIIGLLSFIVVALFWQDSELHSFSRDLVDVVAKHDGVPLPKEGGPARGTPPGTGETPRQPPGAGLSTPSPARPPQKNLELYLQAIEDAAVKTPQGQVKLTPIATTPVTLVTVNSSDPVENRALKRDTWVALAAELKQACRGKRDALLALEQILGLPPYRDEAERQSTSVFRFSLDATHLFRPCVSSPDIATDRCNFDDIVGSAQTSAFILKQMWQSYRIGFKNIGYPFTGMGWSYNWDPASPDHVGISEYIARQDAPVADVTRLRPEEFCGAD
jgi:hypothetical protein